MDNVSTLGLQQVKQLKNDNKKQLYCSLADKTQFQYQKTIE